MLLIKLFKKFLFSFAIAILGLPQYTLAAACCGGGSSAPSVITSDDLAQLTTSFSYSKIDTEVTSNSIWQKKLTDDISQTFKIEGAHIFNDLYQYGFSIPIQQHSKAGSQGGTTSGLADVTGQIGYEYLPDWNYNPWRPRGVGFLSVTLPTGKSIYESDLSSNPDSRGRGFWALGAGTILTKNWFNWDAVATLEVHHAFEKTVNNSQIIGTIKPGNGSSISLGTGYNIKDLRLGASLTWTNEDAINVEGNNPSAGSAQRYATGTLSSSYMFKDNWAGTLSYSDQTLFGDPLNTSLSKIIALSLQKRWSR